MAIKMFLSRSGSMKNHLARWTAAAILSLQMALPTALALASFGSDLVLGPDLFGAAPVIFLGGFIVVWPLALWGSCRLVYQLGV